MQEGFVHGVVKCRKMLQNICEKVDKIKELCYVIPLLRYKEEDMYDMYEKEENVKGIDDDAYMHFHVIGV